MSNNFRENLRNELNYQGITIKELSAKTGIPIPTLDCYLGARSTVPSVDSAVKIARALQVSVEYLVTGENTDTANESNSSMFPGAKSQYKLSKEAQDIIRWVKSLNSEQCKTIVNLIKLFK